LFRTRDGRTLAEALNQADYNERRAEPDWEYAVGVEWKTHFPLTKARRFRGAFANQNIVCKLTEPETVRFVREKFGIGDDASDEGR
jgi:hypothetical protein